MELDVEGSGRPWHRDELVKAGADVWPREKAKSRNNSALARRRWREDQSMEGKAVTTAAAMLGVVDFHEGMRKKYRGKTPVKR